MRWLGRSVRCGRFNLARVMAIMASGTSILYFLITVCGGQWIAPTPLGARRWCTAVIVLTVCGEHSDTPPCIADQHIFPFSQGPFNGIAYLTEYRQYIALGVTVQWEDGGVDIWRAPEAFALQVRLGFLGDADDVGYSPAPSLLILGWTEGWIHISLNRIQGKRKTHVPSQT